MTAKQWERIVKEKIEIKNKQRLINECYKKEKGVMIKKSKTAFILEALNNQEYTRQPCQELLSCTKQETKTILIARFRMLECGANYKGTLKEICRTCNTKDDENHRLNECKQYRSINYYDSDCKLPFDNVFSQDPGTLREIIHKIEHVWNTRNAHGTMLK